MNKTDLVNVVASETNLTKKESEAAINAAINAVVNALQNGEKVQIIGFGTFEVKNVAEREGRNPKTGEVIKIEACKKPSFTASKVLKDQVNS
nr:HU family DNA-binding protein [Oscillospiraceae bacterium]